MSSPQYDIEIFNLTKKYPLRKKKNSILALSNINLKIKKGEIFGLLGPNGAGKTTLASILTTLIQPTSGYATILGHNILEESWFVRENVGLMLGGEMLYYRISGYKNLKFYCKLYGIPNYKTKIKEIAEKFNLSNWLNEYVSNYSKGMKLKLALARVLIIEPNILFLDEPMLGLDPKSVNLVIDLLKNLNLTIFLTSHQMNVVSRLCKRIAFVSNGKILAVDTQDNIKKMISKKILNFKLTIRKKKQELIENLKNLNFVITVRNDENDDIVLSVKSKDHIPELLNFLKDYPIQGFTQIESGLGDIFIKFSE